MINQEIFGQIQIFYSKRWISLGIIYLNSYELKLICKYFGFQIGYIFFNDKYVKPRNEFIFMNIHCLKNDSIIEQCMLRNRREIYQSSKFKQKHFFLFFISSYLTKK